MLLACTLILVLAVPASAAGSSTTGNYPTGNYIYYTGTTSSTSGSYWDATTGGLRAIWSWLSTIYTRLNAWNTSIGYLSRLPSIETDTNTISSYVTSNLPGIKSNSDTVKSKVTAIDTTTDSILAKLDAVNNKLPSSLSGFATASNQVAINSTLSALSDKAATESTLSSFSSKFNTFSTTIPYLTYSTRLIQDGNISYYTSRYNTSTSEAPLKAIADTLISFAGMFVPVYSNDRTTTPIGYRYGYPVITANSSGQLSVSTASGAFIPAVLDSFRSLAVASKTINGNLLKLDEILSTKNDRALEDETDDTKTNVTDYVSDKKSNYGDSFTIGNTISDGLKPDLSTAQASSAIGGLFDSSSSDYWGWFSSETDNDLHPDASGVSTMSLDDVPSVQDVADAETVWVIDPSVTSSDLLADFFGGDD